jgi:hypothetical protein
VADKARKGSLNDDGGAHDDGTNEYGAQDGGKYGVYDAGGHAVANPFLVPHSRNPSRFAWTTSRSSRSTTWTSSSTSTCASRGCGRRCPRRGHGRPRCPPPLIDAFTS